MNKKTVTFMLSLLVLLLLVSTANAQSARSGAARRQATRSATAVITEQATADPGDIYRGTVFGAEQKQYHSDVPGSRPRAKSKLVYDTSLIRAIKLNDADRVRTLLQARVNVNEKNYAGITPMTVAAEKGNMDIIRMLVEDGKADVNAKSSYGITPLIAAASAGQAEVVTYLVKNGASATATDDLGKTATIYAASYDDPDALDDLVSMERATVNMPDNNGNTPLIYAAQKGYLDNVQVLLTAHADVNYKNPTGLSALAAATAEGDLPMVKWLVKNGQADVNITDKNERTPVFYAVENDQPEILNFLLVSGANPNTPDNNGVSPLMNASAKNLQACQKLLLRRKNIDIAAQDKQGRTAVFYSAYSGDVFPAKQLVAARADINTPDNKGNTPLMNAILAKNDRTATFFIQQGADLANVNKAGDSAFTLAKKFLPESSTLTLLDMSRGSVEQEAMQLEAAKLAEVRALEEQLAQEEAAVAELKGQKEAELKQALAEKEAAARAEVEQEYQAQTAALETDPEILQLQQQLETAKAKKMAALQAQKDQRLDEKLGRKPAAVKAQVQETKTAAQQQATQVQRKATRTNAQRRRGNTRRPVATRQATTSGINGEYIPKSSVEPQEIKMSDLIK